MVIAKSTGCDQDQDGSRQHDVFQPFDQLIGACERRLAHADNGHAVQVLQAALDDGDAKNVRHEEDGGGGALKVFKQLDDPGLRAQCQGDVHLAYGMRAHEVRGVFEAADPVRCSIGVHPVVGSVVKIADEVDALVVRLAQRAGHFDTQGCRPDNHRRAAIFRQSGVAADQIMADGHGHPLRERCQQCPPHQRAPVEIAQAGGRVAAQQQDGE